MGRQGLYHGDNPIAWDPSRPSVPRDKGLRLGPGQVTQRSRDIFCTGMGEALTEVSRPTKSGSSIAIAARSRPCPFGTAADMSGEVLDPIATVDGRVSRKAH